MAPKKKQQEKMSLGAFLQDDNFGGGGSWADEVEDSFGSQPLPSGERRTGYSSANYLSGPGNDRGMGYANTRDTYPSELPTRPPYTAHLGNLSYEATQESVADFFADCEITSVRIIEDRIEQRPKGFAYAEFRDVEGLKKALTLDGESFQGRSIRVKIADPPKDRMGDRMGDGGDAVRSLSSWDRKGPLADLPRSNDRRDFSERRGPPRDGPVDDGKVRDFGNWERRGPLTPLPPADRPESRSRPRTNDGPREEFMRNDRRASPATWGEGRQDSRPPRSESRDLRERADRAERTATAAELDNQWRNNMRPGKPSPGQSRDGSEAPPSPAGSAAVLASGGRPKLNLQKRTVSEAPGILSPASSTAGDAKANPFGAARPIDTAAKEREIAEKKEQAAKEKREADEKLKEERRIAKETAAKEAAEKEAAAEEEAAAKKETAAAAEAEAEKVKEAEAEKAKEAEAKPASETSEAPKEAQVGQADEQRIPTRPKEQVENPKARAFDTGNWRAASGESRNRGGYQSAPRGARGDSRGGRGSGGPQRGGNRFEGGRPSRANGSGHSPATSQSSAAPATPDAEEAAPDGWTTVPAKGRRNQSTRA